jgi:predicted nucleic acid-binding protein
MVQAKHSVMGWLSTYVRHRLLAWQATHIDLLHSAFPVFPLTPQIVLEAVRGVRDHQLSYYDSQIWACARLNQIPVVFSEDFQDGQLLEGVNFVNPFADQFDIEMW